MTTAEPGDDAASSRRARAATVGPDLIAMPA